MQFRFQSFGTLLLAGGAALFVVISCTKDVGKPSGFKCVPTISYTNTIKSLVDEQCVSCHSPVNSSGGQDFTTYEGLRSAADNGLLEGVIFKGTPNLMPYGTTGLPESQKQMIRCWLDNGKQK